MIIPDFDIIPFDNVRVGDCDNACCEKSISAVCNLLDDSRGDKGPPPLPEFVSEF